MKRLLIGLMIAALGVAVAYGTALTDNRDTPTMAGKRINIEVYTNVHIYAGSLVAANASGKAVPAADSQYYSVIGRAVTEVNNVGVKNGATIDIDRGIFRWEQTGEITDANIGATVFVKDDQTITTSNTSYYIIAGAIVDYDAVSGDVWVDTFDIGAQGAAAPATLTVAGAGTIGTTLGVGGAATLVGDVTCKDDLTVNTNFQAGGTGAIGGTFHAVGDGTFDDDLTVRTNATVGGTLGVTGIASFTASPQSSSFTVTGGTNLILKQLVIDGTNHLVGLYGVLTNRIATLQ